MYIRRKVFSLRDENGLEQKEFATVRGTRDLMNKTLRAIEKYQKKNPGATKEEIQKFIKKNSRLKKGVETLGEHHYRHVGGEQGAKKFVEAVGGKQGKFIQTTRQRMEQIEKNIPKPELPKLKAKVANKVGGVEKVAPKVPEPINYPRLKKNSTSNVSPDSIRSQMKLKK